MRNIFLAAASVTAALFALPSFASTPTPIHFIYAETGTQQQFQNDRDDCAQDAKKLRLNPLGRGQWQDRPYPSSTVFLRCMADKGYTLSKEGWDTGVLWTLPFRPAH
jgi:hypothetical protein